MKIECNRKKFLEVFHYVPQFAAKQNAEAILQQALIQTISDTEIEIKATNLESGIRAIVKEVTVFEKGVILLPCAKALQILKESKGETFELSTEGNFTVIVSDGGKFKLNTGELFKSEEFPPIDSESGSPIEILSERLDEMVSQVIFCSAKESSRYMLNGVLFFIEQGKLSVVATDGKRLALSCEPIEYTRDDLKHIVPASGLTLLKSIAKEEKTLIFFSPNKVWFKTGDITVSLKLLEGRFPKYQDVIPKNNSLNFSANTKDLLNKMKQVALMAPEKSRVVSLGFKKGRLELTSMAAGVGESEVIGDIEYSGEETKLGVNPDYLIDILKSWQGEEIEVSFKDEETALMVSEGSLLYIVMPISLKG